MLPDIHGTSVQSRVDFAIQLARETGRAALAFRSESNLAELGVEVKGPQDFVTLADRKAEETIHTALRNSFPKDGFMGEETGGVADNKCMWVVDPIDGTTNYMRGFRYWGVSIAFVVGDNVEIGIIYDATMDAVYSAVRGGGAFKDGKPISASNITDPHKAMAIVGHSRQTSFDEYITVLKTFYDMGMDYRHMGAAAIGLVRVADGTADVFYERHLHGWDMLAGARIAREAGADVFMPSVNTSIKDGGAIVANTIGLNAQYAFLRELIGPPCSTLS